MKAMTLVNCNIKNNSTNANGGGVYSDEYLTIKGSTVTDNFATDKGGGIFLGKGSEDDTKIEGAITVKDNSAGTFGDNLFLNKGVTLKVTGSLLDSETNIDLDSGTGVITEDYDDYNSGSPSSYFIPAKGYQVELIKGEAEITSGWAQLKKDIENYKGTETFKLEKDYAAKPSDDRIKIPAGKEITIDLNGHTLNRNRMSSDKDGHVFEVFGTLTIIDSSTEKTGTITGGWAKKGGGINVNATGTVNFEAGTITGNRATQHGGGVYVHGTFNMKGGKIEDNSAEKNGGGIALGSGTTLTISGGSITDNNAGEHGGAINVAAGSTVSIKGNPVVKGNRASLSGADAYLSAGIRLNVTGVLTQGTAIGVSMENTLGEFTSNYSTYNSGVGPARYFKSPDGYAVALKNNEAELKLDVSFGETETEKPFLSRNDQVNTDSENLSSTNWMSGIPGDRYLNEINIPGSHDSGMNSVHSVGYNEDCTSLACMFASGYAASYAKTQREYIYQQLAEGAREIDIRLSERYKKKYIRLTLTIPTLPST